MEYFYLIYPIIFQYSVLILQNVLFVRMLNLNNSENIKPKILLIFPKKMRLTNWQTVLNTIEPQLAYSSFQNIYSCNAMNHAFL